MWSKNHPTKEGYYWVRTKGILSKKEYIHPVRIYSSQKDKKVDTVFSDGENFSIKSDMFSQWYLEEISLPLKIDIS